MQTQKKSARCVCLIKPLKKQAKPLTARLAQGVTEPEIHDMRTPLLAGLVFLTGLTAAQAQAPVCTQQINALMAEWNAIGFHESGKPGAPASGKGGHTHTQASLELMKTHIRMAAQQCKEGNDHSALLHLDVVRAWLKLDDEVHPAWHFTPPG